MATKSKAAAKPSKSTKQPASKRSASPRKRAAKKSVSAKRAGGKSGGRTPTPTAVGRVASVLPGTLRDAKYVKRTLEILDARERKAERLNEQTKKQLVGVVEEMRGDVNGRIESEREAAKKRVDKAVDRAKKTKVGKVVDAFPKRLTKVIDRVLGRVGLTRKSKAS